MQHRKKLFIIGSGASKQLPDYPTGAELLDNIINYINKIDTNFDVTINGQELSTIIKESITNSDDAKKAISLMFNANLMEDFKITALLSLLVKIHSPNSIDYFIQNLDRFFLPEYETITSCENIKNKAQEIVQNIIKDAKKRSYEDQNLQKQDIYFYKILQNLEGKFSNISIINFNYDTILEEIFEYFVQNRNKEKDPYSVDLEKLKEIIEKSHVYGDIEKGISFIRKINDHKIEEYWNMFLNADDIYFLGFGFDDMNIKNIGLNKIKQNYDSIIKKKPLLNTPYTETEKELIKIKNKRIFGNNAFI